MPIREQYDEIVRCNRCGFCQVACPIFRATGQEAGVARGRIAMLRALIEGRATWSKDLEDPLFACLLCGACTANCFPAVATADLITAARTEYLEKVGRNPLHKLLFDRMLPYPVRIRLAGHAAGLGKKTKASKAAKALGLLRCFGRDFEQSEEIIERFPSQAFREISKPGEFPGEGESLRIGYFVGCGTDVMCPQAGEAALRLLRQIGKTVTVLDNCCCGLPPHCYGEKVSAQRLAEKNLAQLSSKPFDLIVTDCSSCAAFLKKYPTLFPVNDHTTAGGNGSCAQTARSSGGGHASGPTSFQQRGARIGHLPRLLPRGSGTGSLIQPTEAAEIPQGGRIPRTSRSGLVLRRCRLLCAFALRPVAPCP